MMLMNSTLPIHQMNVKEFDMPKFKIGDKVRIVSAKYDWKKRYIGGTFVITENEGRYDGEPSWSAPDRKSFGYRWKESELELVTSTTFEVGKRYKYKHRDDKRIYTATIEYISVIQNKAIGYWNDELQSIAALPLDRFEKYVEIKPEDWRCLHYTNETPSLGGIPYKSESEVVTIYKNSPGFVKAVRVDA